MKVVLFLFAAILIMLCAALVCPVEINARARVKPRFGEVQAVQDLSFRVKEGELFAFLGVNCRWRLIYG